MRTNKNKRIVIVLLLGILLMSGLACCPEGLRSAPTPTPTPIRMAIGQLIADYRDNEISADAKYKDKVLEVTGVVTSIGSFGGTEGGPYIVIMESPHEPFGVGANLAPGEEDKAANLSKGDTITVIGICVGEAGNIWLRNCYIYGGN